MRVDTHTHTNAQGAKKKREKRKQFKTEGMKLRGRNGRAIKEGLEGEVGVDVIIIHCIHV